MFCVCTQCNTHRDAKGTRKESLTVGHRKTMKRVRRKAGKVKRPAKNDFIVLLEAYVQIRTLRFKTKITSQRQTELLLGGFLN